MSQPQSTNRVWFITGTSSGIGKALVIKVLAAGHSVIATARNPQSLQTELSQVYNKETLKRLLVVKLDVTRPEQVKTALNQGVENFGRLDVVVNNAEYAVQAEVEPTPPEEARKEFEVMFCGPVYVSREAVQIFREVSPRGEGGLIFNISSAGGYRASPTIAFYAASKFALEGFTDALQKELHPDWNIKCTIIQPGGFNTEWRGGNMTVFPIHFAYTEANAAKYRALHDSISFIGDPVKGAKALFQLSEKKAELPLRIQLGSDSFAIVKYQSMKTIEAADKWESVAHSTNEDGVDADEYMKQLLLALG